jgi:phosphoribosyl-ATP pyrophosphohydrolase
MTIDTLERLAATIRLRRSATAQVSYTRALLDGGVERCAKKLGEEATEAVIAALSQDDTALRNEAADVLYHLLVLLEARGIEWASVAAVLEGRMGTSGHDEKSSRPAGRS